MKKIRLVCLIFIFLLLIAYAFGASRLGRKSLLTDEGVVSLFTPLAIAYEVTVESISSVVRHYVLLSGASQENDSLKDLVVNLKLRNISLSKELNLSIKDKDLSSHYEFLGKELIRSTILGYDPFSPSKTIWIDVGRKQGIDVNSVVVTEKGLVGRVIQTFKRSSKVLLLIDSYFSVDAMSKRTSKRSVVKGLRSDLLQLSQLPFLSHVEFMEGRNEFEPGDELETTGFGGIYPAGIAVGKVLSDDKIKNPFKKSLVLPAVDFTKLRTVYVIK